MHEPIAKFVEGMLACNDPKSDKCNDTIVRLHLLAETEPRVVWDVIRQVLARKPSDQVLGALASGPLEDLMWMHGREMIDELEAEARHNPALRQLLGGIYRGDQIDDETWARIVRISGRVREMRSQR